MPGIESSTILINGFGDDAKIGDKTVPVNGLWASSDFFNVFSGFNLIKGNAATALSAPNSIVLTEDAAYKIFADDDPLGQTIQLGEDKPYTVTGLMENPPHNSHLNFESLGSFITYENEMKLDTDNNNWLGWGNMWSNYAYVVLDENTSAEQVNQHLKNISDEENKKNDRVTINVSLQALGEIMPGEELSNNIGLSMDTKVLWLLSGLTFIVILSAGFNYTNYQLPGL